MFSEREVITIVFYRCGIHFYINTVQAFYALDYRGYFNARHSYQIKAPGDIFIHIDMADFDSICFLRTDCLLTRFQSYQFFPVGTEQLYRTGL